MVQELKRLHENIQDLHEFHSGFDEVGRGAWVNSTVCQQLQTVNPVANYSLKEYFFTVTSSTFIALCQAVGLRRPPRERYKVNAGSSRPGVSKPRLGETDRLAGLVVKASASGAEDPQFHSRLHRGIIFPGQIMPVTLKLALHWLHCQAPGDVGSVLGLIGPVSVYCDWVG